MVTLGSFTSLEGYTRQLPKLALALSCYVIWLALRACFLSTTEGFLGVVVQVWFSVLVLLFLNLIES